MLSNFSFPTRIVFGPGALSQLPNLIKEHGAKKVLLITDPGLVQAGLADRVLNTLKGHVETICFDGVEPNPTEACMEAATQVLRTNLCDLVIGLGGGSAIDTAKAACFRLNHTGSLAPYEIQVDGHLKITNAVPPLIAIPTTSGTGSEVGRSAVITNKEEGRKVVIYSPKLLPIVALCDPELTIGLPPHITAATGMDALTHNLEAYLATTYHPICGAIALGGIRLVSENLERAVKKGSDIEARGNMMLASSMGAISFQKDLGVAHALAHPLSTLADVPHGLANAIVLPHTMAFNKSVAAAHLKDVAQALGCKTDGKTNDESADLAIAFVHDLLARVDIPNRLSLVGITQDLIPALAQQAIADANHRSNPRPCTEQDMVALYHAAF
ncbi:MAG: 4-hydroxybutyrate dehydrogenase [Candidatus Latescibacterota bacterium]|jgi:4-hydroxybutyrate dehydrogenase